jgi:hypothetical protein
VAFLLTLLSLNSQPPSPAEKGALDLGVFKKRFSFIPQPPFTVHNEALDLGVLKKNPFKVRLIKM